jgi:hypothetical protein
LLVSPPDAKPVLAVVLSFFVAIVLNYKSHCVVIKLSQQWLKINESLLNHFILVE